MDKYHICVMSINHPSYGVLKVDEFIRKKSEIEEIIKSLKIKWQGNYYPVIQYAETNGNYTFYVLWDF